MPGHVSVMLPMTHMLHDTMATMLHVPPPPIPSHPILSYTKLPCDKAAVIYYIAIICNSYWLWRCARLAGGVPAQCRRGNLAGGVTTIVRLMERFDGCSFWVLIGHESTGLSLQSARDDTIPYRKYPSAKEGSRDRSFRTADIWTTIVAFVSCLRHQYIKLRILFPLGRIIGRTIIGPLSFNRAREWLLLRILGFA